MEVHINDEKRSVNIYLYGVDGEERTEEFFDRYLSTTFGIRRITENEKKRLNISAVYVIAKGSDYTKLVNSFTKLQAAIDNISDEFVFSEDEKVIVEKYTFDGCNFII